MILVTLGTQDKSFDRLLKAIDKQIDEGNLKDRVVVQAGYTKYESKNMEVFDYIDRKEFSKLLLDADLIITHGGVGTIMTAVKSGKRVIGAARLAQYGEHHNDHQTQVLESFDDEGYLIYAKDLEKLAKYIEKSRTFNPKKIVSNTTNFIKLIEDFMEKN
ncbi:PssE/Cps14G family polysaccharide biosynthesis glycosyltransferase [Anaerorhabdus sp.]|jgi:UDP-N-acetylglucosamine transferase subunit ALG13|uniref:PssE/Cps14G family polysaccharide biosynthesis glycosyltransferase n=1 Tax=Anaerorhabdus sp. TaxID=1872524 RepID=UPI002FC7AE29